MNERGQINRWKLQKLILYMFKHRYHIIKSFLNDNFHFEFESAHVFIWQGKYEWLLDQKIVKKHEKLENVNLK